MDKQEKQTAEMYNRFGRGYHNYRKLEKNFYNSLLEMPTVLSFLKNIKGKKILDIGCGSGIYSEILKKRGAIVYGIDISKTLINIANEEVEGVNFKVANIKKIPFKKNTFDIALSALMLGYIKDWNSAFKEVWRVLKPNGIYIFSIDNPIYESKKGIKINDKDYKILGYSKGGKIIGNYFKEGWQRYRWMNGGMVIKNHHKTYETIINTILKNGFSIEGYKDAKPILKGKKIASREYKKSSRLPLFCIFKIKKN